MFPCLDLLFYLGYDGIGVGELVGLGYFVGGGGGLGDVVGIKKVRSGIVTF